MIPQLTKSQAFLSIIENADVEKTLVFTSRNACAGISGASCSLSAAARILQLSTPNFDLIFIKLLVQF